MTLQRARAPPGRQNGLCGLAHFPTPPSPPTLSTHAQRGRAGRRMRRPHPFPTVRRAGVRCGLRLRGKERPCSWPPPGCPARWQACFACAAPAPPPTHTHGGPADQWSARGGGQTSPRARAARRPVESPHPAPRRTLFWGGGTVVVVGSEARVVVGGQDPPAPPRARAAPPSLRALGRQSTSRATQAGAIVVGRAAGGWGGRGNGAGCDSIVLRIESLHAIFSSENGSGTFGRSKRDSTRERVAAARVSLLC